MPAERAAPCRHPGVPPDSVVRKVAEIVSNLAQDVDFLASKGLSAEEYSNALPLVIEKIRGSRAAKTSTKKEFLEIIFDEMLRLGLISQYQKPIYGTDTVHRLSVSGVGDIAIIQKGCPDGAHSSRTWSIPDWAVETYIWWMCPSLSNEPGQHIWKGVGRIRQRFFNDKKDGLNGVIFHNELCGSNERPCPKQQQSIQLHKISIPPPCIYILPKYEENSTEWNWRGERTASFPSVLLSLFGISDAFKYTGHVGFKKHGSSFKVTIRSEYGTGRSTNFRS